MSSFYQSPNTGELACNSFQELSTDEGQVTLGEVTRNNVKMAVMIRRIFPHAQFTTSQYIALQMSGKLDGAIIASAPSCFTVLCGEKPLRVDDNNAVGAYIRAENGDIILSAPNGRVTIMARDIDLISRGNGTDTGFINQVANSKITQSAPTIQLEAQDAISASSERDMNFNAPGELEISAGDVHMTEGPDVSPVTSPLGSGTNDILRQAKGVLKLIESLL
tara:strand:+ start:417 stop:1079 length:663 start_codon:yes stop_codon:yes gene_type:complete